MIIELLAVARQIFNNHLVDTITKLDKFKEEEEVLPQPKI
jgi:ArsR family transcriptional regulator